MAKKIVRKVKKVKRKYGQKQKQKQSQKVIINIGKPKPTRKRKRKSKPKPFYSETLSSVLVQQQQPAFSTADLQTLLNAQRQTSVVGSLPKTEKAKTTIDMGTSPLNLMDEAPARAVARAVSPARETELMGREDIRVAEDIRGILEAEEIPQVPMKKLPANPREEEYYTDPKFDVYVPRGFTFDPTKRKLTARQGFSEGTARRALIRESLISGVEARNPRATRQPNLTGATPTFSPRLGNYMAITQEIGERDLPNLTEGDMREMGYI